MNEKVDKNVFEKICEPLQPVLKEVIKSMPDDSEKYKLSLGAFTSNLIFAVICQIKTIGKLVVEIKTSSIASDIGLVVASKSMYSESFRRYDPGLFRKIFGYLLLSCNFLSIPEIQSFGQILLVDGSIFPAISSMDWAKYKKGSNALKMQLAFELNRMIPAQFLCTEGNYSEKKFLRDIIEKGITYVCDRGYISFGIFKFITEKKAFFIIRGKLNAVYDQIETLEIIIPGCFLKFFDNIEDKYVVFKNDLNKCKYRIVKFTSLGESYILITNRFDLSTYEIIMLYAYRWQIELYFRFFKRTFKGIHLMCTESQGIQVQFYIYMITHLLILLFKQKCEKQNSSESKDPLVKENEGTADSPSQNNTKGVRIYVCGLVSLLGDKLKKRWKISLHWLIAVKNYLSIKFTKDVIYNLAKFT